MSTNIGKSAASAYTPSKPIPIPLKPGSSPRPERRESPSSSSDNEDELQFLLEDTDEFVKPEKETKSKKETVPLHVLIQQELEKREFEPGSPPHSKRINPFF